MPQIDNHEWYIIQDENNYALAGSGGYSTPKLYKRSDAIRICRKNNKRSLDWHNRYGHALKQYMIYPVTLKLGNGEFIL